MSEIQLRLTESLQYKQVSGTVEFNVVHVLQIFPETTPGKFTRKPVLQLVEDSRPELLRKLADWMEGGDGDPDLKKLIELNEEERRLSSASG